MPYILLGEETGDDDSLQLSKAAAQLQRRRSSLEIIQPVIPGPRMKRSVTLTQGGVESR
jgi:hypothetical protein